MWSTCRARKNAASDAASVAATVIAQTSSRMSSAFPQPVTGFGICELTVVSCAVTQNSAPPQSWNPEPGWSCSSAYMATVARASRAIVATKRNINRERSRRCASDSPRMTMRTSAPMWRMPGGGMPDGRPYVDTRLTVRDAAADAGWHRAQEPGSVAANVSPEDVDRRDAARDEAELLARLRDGDEHAFAGLVDRCHP